MLRIIYKLSQFKNNFRTHFFLFNDTTTTDIYTLSLHDALPISRGRGALFPAIHLGDGPGVDADRIRRAAVDSAGRSEEHTSELQSRGHLVCRLLLEKKKTHDQNGLLVREPYVPICDGKLIGNRL